ncbi:four helix bundle protein [Thalassotalea mangrovi]|uniref:Four helix bundle protein n=1 Tax=Thalassotalea mangrovi TaxID=2572245 RepID=A0A4U1B6X9_9GAMM|nr:four helix bundle protein [Thalassotalea mangrovi]TKB46167.1 four helix bundle protein [Thalassotalea mangrovi]
MYHEKLNVWQRSCNLSVEIYQLTNALSDFGFRNQITRSSLSVASNIAEGIEKPTINDKIKFLFIAKGSLAELKTQLVIGERIGYLSNQHVAKYKQETEELDRMLSGLIKKVESRRQASSKVESKRKAF